MCGGANGSHQILTVCRRVTWVENQEEREAHGASVVPAAGDWSVGPAEP